MAMAKNLVICFDGTSNKYSANNTNVVRLYQLLERGAANQVVYYQTGIGTLSPPGFLWPIKRWLIEKVDLAVAWLLEDHVVAGYRYLMRNYETGDQIFIFGFSRGAYTARVLAGMLGKIGLLSSGNEELLGSAWSLYKKPDNQDLAKGFKATFCRDVHVKFLGLWDTVNSVGLLFSRSLPNTADNSTVEIVRHAAALNERRVKFIQNLWKQKHSVLTDVEEVWFPGVHSDVGGGYETIGPSLSNITLIWMVEHAVKAGIRLDPAAQAQILKSSPMDIVANAAAQPKHESLTGWWWILEVLPLPYKDPRREYKIGVRIHFGHSRYLLNGAKIHHSVIERQKSVPSYVVKNLPDQYDVVS